MRRLLFATTLMLCAACRDRAPSPGDRATSSSGATPGEYLFVWAGDSSGASSDFLAVLDADPSSSTYGAVVASIPTGATNTHPHHTEAEMPRSGHL
ncbi:MAG TPA: hypothetical protein VE869_16495, partial [Gemmatimonas sp.]|nr:hypothetical protein [Gemmatimonas sp.]